MMPFGLKNASATYQRLVNRMFRDQIERNVEVYVDDMLVKSRKAISHLTDLEKTFQIQLIPANGAFGISSGKFLGFMLVKSRKAISHMADLEETFNTLRRYQMKLNPAKCAFGVSSGKFLGFMVSSRGIEANPKKIRVVLEMQAPRTTKQLQQLTGRIAALNRFISRSMDKCLPFFKILRKTFVWSNECEEAFGQLKEYLANPPLLSSPEKMGNSLPIPSSIAISCQLGLSPRRVRITKTSIFHQQGATRSRRKVSPD
jgi:hypothetical protein